MPVALEDLRGRRRRLQPEPLAGEPLDLRVDRRVRSDGAGELADAKPLERPRDPHAIPVELERPAGELEPERRRLGVHAVRPPHHQRPAVALGLLEDGRERPFDPFEDQRSRFPDLQRQRGVENVRGRQPVVEPAPDRPERLRDRVHERSDVVLRPLLDLGHPLRRRRLRTRRISRAASSGTAPTEAHPSSAASSTSSQRASLLSSDQTRAMAGRE